MRPWERKLKPTRFRRQDEISLAAPKERDAAQAAPQRVAAADPLTRWPLYIGTDTQYGVRLAGGQKLRIREQNTDPASRPLAQTGEAVNISDETVDTLVVVEVLLYDEDGEPIGAPAKAFLDRPVIEPDGISSFWVPIYEEDLGGVSVDEISDFVFEDADRVVMERNINGSGIYSAVSYRITYCPRPYSLVFTTSRLVVASYIQRVPSSKRASSSRTSAGFSTVKILKMCDLLAPSTVISSVSP